MTALGEEEKIFTAMTHRLPDEFFTGVVAFGGINNVEPFIERALQKCFNGFHGGLLVTNFGPPKPDDRNVHIRFAQPSLFHSAQNVREKSRHVTRGAVAAAYHINCVLPVPRAICPIRLARKSDMVFRASRSETIATRPMPMLKTWYISVRSIFPFTRKTSKIGGTRQFLVLITASQVF